MHDVNDSVTSSDRIELYGIINHKATDDQPTFLPKCPKGKEECLINITFGLITQGLPAKLATIQKIQKEKGRFPTTQKEGDPHGLTTQGITSRKAGVYSEIQKKKKLQAWNFKFKEKESFRFEILNLYYLLDE
jgi:hypothetical protein